MSKVPNYLCISLVAVPDRRYQKIEKIHRVSSSVCSNVNPILYRFVIIIVSLIEGSKSQGSGGNNYTNGGTGSQVLGVKSSIRVGNAASNSVESGGGALAHDGAGTSGVTAATSTVNPSVSASAAANQPAHPHPTHKHLLRSRIKQGNETKDITGSGSVPVGGKSSGKHHKKETTTGSCSSLRCVNDDE